MLKLDSFVFSGAPRTRMVSFPCNASTNCSTVYTRSKLVACRTHLVSGSYSFFSALAHIPQALQKAVPSAHYCWCHGQELLPPHPSQSHCQRLVGNSTSSTSGEQAWSGNSRYQRRSKAPLKNLLILRIHLRSLLRIIILE